MLGPRRGALHEEPSASIAHARVCEGRGRRGYGNPYSGTKPETVDTCQGDAYGRDRSSPTRSQRLDVIVGIGANLDYLIHETGRSGVIKKSSFEIETKDPAYIAVSKKSKHKGVVPRLEKALSDMRRANEIEQIERSFLEALARDKP